MLIEELKTLVAVIENDSITGAAAALCLTQSAISRRIQHLEESLDAILFDRNSKPPRATALAHRIYRHALPLLRDVRYLLDIPRGESTPTGAFRLGLTQVVADVVLVDVVSQMKAEFPLLELQMRTEWSTSLLAQVHSGSLDVATIMVPTPSTCPSGVTGLKVGKLEMVVVQSKTKPLVRSSELIEELASHQWVLKPDGCGTRGFLERTMANSGKQLKLVADTQGNDMQLRLVAAGLGLGLVSRPALLHSRHSDELAIVDVPNFSLTQDIWLVHPEHQGNLYKAVAELGDILKRSFDAYSASK